MAITTTSHPIGRPDDTEAEEYYFTYIDQVGDGDIRDILEAQSRDALALFENISDEHSLYRYAPDKWSIREVVGHMNDTERLFVFRALWFARGIDESLPGFDQDVAAEVMGADERSWAGHIEEFRAVRAATVSFFRNLPAEAWMRGGVASGFDFSVRGLAYITAGHVAHHLRILRDQYLQRS